MEELHHYLRQTSSPMSVDLFDFDYWVHCLAEFVLDKCFVNIKVSGCQNYFFFFFYLISHDNESKMIR